jgi:hypothetical protein
MAETTTYEGSCHCGKVRFEARADLSKVIECNCSICSRKGALMAFVPAEVFTLKSGEGAVTDYQFGKKHIHHFFCSTCGIHAHGMGAGPDGKLMHMLNVRCLDGVDLSTLKVDHFDGKKL